MEDRKHDVLLPDTDYQAKKDELAREVLFLRAYGRFGESGRVSSKEPEPEEREID